MSGSPSPGARAFGILVLTAIAGVVIWGLGREPKRPASRRLEAFEDKVEELAAKAPEERDKQLVRQLLAENLDQRRFSFPTIVEAVSDKKVIPLDPTRESHQRVTTAINESLKSATAELSQTDSPIHQLSRINEASRFFEEALLEQLNAAEGLACEIPTTRDGEHQRSGYPDLRIIDEASGDIFYLDPKLVDRDSWDSSFRSFYFEPKDKTLKINDNAVHLLAGIEHDGKTREWSFTNWKIIDLSTLSVRLKAEFQASNKDLYR